MLTPHPSSYPHPLTFAADAENAPTAPATIQMNAVHTCCPTSVQADSPYCAKENCWGDSHITTADGTHFDAYHRVRESLLSVFVCVC